MLKVTVIVIATVLFAGCATVDSQIQSAAAPSTKAAAEENTGAGEAEPQGKMSLDAALDEYDKVTLLDDDTLEEKLICRKIEPPTGTRYGSRKLCASRQQWEDQAKKGEDTLNDVVRRRSGGEFNQ